jgi:uncharacterized membrane protein YeaQ/YmgE (transglycosylase-associated protein family)
MIGIISMVVVGAIVGVLARFFYPGHIPLNLGYTILLGIAGSFVAGLIVSAVSPDARGKPFHPAGFIGSILGSILLIFVARHFFHWI